MESRSLGFGPRIKVRGLLLSNSHSLPSLAPALAGWFNQPSGAQLRSSLCFSWFSFSPPVQLLEGQPLNQPPTPGIWTCTCPIKAGALKKKIRAQFKEACPPSWWLGSQRNRAKDVSLSLRSRAMPRVLSTDTLPAPPKNSPKEGLQVSTFGFLPNGRTPKELSLQKDTPTWTVIY